MDKRLLRTHIRQLLQALSPQEQADRSHGLIAQLLATPHWAAANTVGLFAALPGEPDLAPLWPHRGSRTFAYPRITGDHLTFHRIATPADLHPSRWNLLEPIPAPETLLPPTQLDLILVPGLAFTPTGHRMGRGRGYYDRLLATPSLRAITLGLCFREQLVETLPLEAHDLPVHQILAI